MSNGKPFNIANIEGIEKDVNLTKSVNERPDSTRLYKHKGSRVKKALSFRTKANRSKLA